MIKLFVADDEAMIKEGIRNCIESRSDQYTICGEAPDGEMALPLIQELKPDVLIADVCMPFIDGLELSAVVKRTMSWVHIIILSGHDEFEYAQKAVSIGVDSYLLKPVNSEKLLQALDEAARQIEAERQVYENLEETLKRDELEKTIIRDHFLSRLVSGKVAVNEVLDFSQSHNINIIAKQYVVCRILLTGLNAGDLTKIRLMGDKLFGVREDIICFIKGADRFVFIVKGNARKDVRETAYEAAQILVHQFKLYLSIDVSVGIGSLTDRIGGLPQSYQDARTVFNEMGFKGGYIFGFDDLKKKWGSAEMDLSPAVSLEEKLRHAAKEDIARIVEQYFVGFEETSMDSMLYRYYLLIDLVVTVSRLTKEKSGIKPVLTPQELLAISESRTECITYANMMLEDYIDRDEEQSAISYGREIRYAKAYINQNYNDPSISLHMAAKMAGFSPNYFSTVFSQETGETFIEYLTHRRIKAAKELLLNTQKKTSDIAFEVGYGDPHYFSYVFKKKTGMSPKEFKKES